MTVSEVIKNITEIQEPKWYELLTNDEKQFIKDTQWLIIRKLLSVKLENQKMLEIFLQINQFVGAIGINKIYFGHFYMYCIGVIPKGKYKFKAVRKKKSKKNKVYDEELLHLLSKELKDSKKSSKHSYDMLEHLGKLEEESERLFKKYHHIYDRKPKYFELYKKKHEMAKDEYLPLRTRYEVYIKLKNKLKKQGYIKRRETLFDLSLREYLYQKTGISQTQSYRLMILKEKNLTLFHLVLDDKVTLNKAYLKVKGKQKDVSKELALKRLKKEFIKYKEILSKEEIHHLADKVFKVKNTFFN